MKGTASPPLACWRVRNHTSFVLHSKRTQPQQSSGFLLDHFLAKMCQDLGTLQLNNNYPKLSKRIQHAASTNETKTDPSSSENKSRFKDTSRTCLLTGHLVIIQYLLGIFTNLFWVPGPTSFFLHHPPSRRGRHDLRIRK